MARAWLFGDDLDTDQMVPGRYAPFMVGLDKFQNYAFHDARPTFVGGKRILGFKPGEGELWVADIPEVASLEQMLEGNSEGEGEGAAAPVPSTPVIPSRRKKPSMWRSLIIALVVIIILGAATFFVLHTLGIFKSDGPGDNQDIVKP